MRALLIPASDDDAVVRDITGDLDSLKAAIGGGHIEIINGGDWHLYCDEEGTITGQKPNVRASALAWELGWTSPQGLVGDVVFLGPNEDDPAEEGPVPDEVLDLARTMFEVRTELRSVE